MILSLEKHLRERYCCDYQRRRYSAQHAWINLEDALNEMLLVVHRALDSAFRATPRCLHHNIVRARSLSCVSGTP